MGTTAPNELRVLVQSLSQLVRAARECQSKYAHLSHEAKMPRLRQRLSRMNVENECLADELHRYTRQYGIQEEEETEVVAASPAMDWDEELDGCESGTVSILNAFESVMEHRCLTAFPELYKTLTKRREYMSENLSWLRNIRTTALA
ncbi:MULTISPECIES: hypothetical protein [unclassified Siphonobacter]|uniref:hypothetical protein n=1 Tax=unclassified Siphonobacter TaxID=2635712 RepID=UPI00278858BD|nr:MULTISPECIES: hypothetical protein [unclassified Siphonobacter]MDQ1089449.1 septation ring formation regulator EzrA [Siphonobacter sp. SORGH_AS_1065]MDR6195685.1 septation ring formation regulator EzrA [Siphonobacter sp. SORGH_AS_0500]